MRPGPARPDGLNQTTNTNRVGGLGRLSVLFTKQWTPVPIPSRRRFRDWLHARISESAHETQKRQWEGGRRAGGEARGGGVKKGILSTPWKLLPKAYKKALQRIIHRDFLR